MLMVRFRALLLSLLTIWMLFVISAAPTSASAAERIGTLEVSDLFLEPEFHDFEPRSGRFEAGDSYVGFRWTLDPTISGTALVGSSDLIIQPRRYALSTSRDENAELALVEAYAEARGAIGEVRLGQVSLPFGTESGRAEAERRLPRTLLYREDLIGLRDLGLAFAVENHGFASEWAIHNGEGGADKDNQIWFTSRWSWRGEDGLFIGFSGSVGRTTPASTQAPSGQPPRTLADAGLEPDESSKVRVGNLFFEWAGQPVGLTVEATAGEALQAIGKTKFRGSHFDAYWTLGPQWRLHGRFDRVEPNNRVVQDRVEETTFGVSLRNRYETSVIYVLASRVVEEGRASPSHEVRLIWRLTPLAMSRANISGPR